MQSAESHLELTFKIRCTYTIHLNLSHNESQRFNDTDRLDIRF